MFNPLERSEPVSAEPYVANGVTISLAPPMSRYSLRARQAGHIETLLGAKVPEKIGNVVGGIACLGPDEWLMRATADAVANATVAQAFSHLVAVTDVSDRSICLIVKGPRAAETITAGCPLDLDHFATGRATRTVFETVEIILIRVADNEFHIEVWRSFADWLWLALINAAQDG